MTIDELLKKYRSTEMPERDKGAKSADEKFFCLPIRFIVGNFLACGFGMKYR